jgi:hypothetical protein
MIAVLAPLLEGELTVAADEEGEETEAADPHGG